MAQRRLPSLNALRAFEAAARHLNFTKASEELFVTQAAVSQQIKLLEDQMALKLFRRVGRSVLLTEEGQELLPRLTAIFDELAEACRDAQNKTEQGALVISTTDSFAALWLLPRLRLFREAHPEIDVRLSAVDRLVDFSRDDVDLALRHGSGQYDGVDVLPLMPDEVFPVCSPALMAGPKAPKTPEDLKNHSLICDGFPGAWERWLKAADLKPDNFTMDLIISHSHLVYQAARSGQGIAIGRAVMVADDLAAGRLVKPFDLSVPSPTGYYIVAAQGGLDRPKAKSFVNWLVGIVREEQKAGHLPSGPHKPDDVRTRS